VVENAAEAGLAAAGLARDNRDAKTALIGQTTIESEEYGAIGEEIRRFFPDLEIMNTICGATLERQKALRELCPKVDAVIIAGGRDSANTRRLLSIALELGKPAWLVESADDIPPEIKTYKTVGLSAGASTPESLIDEIEETLKAF
jgi:4-hydroxy-3-methylbut-2-enyl diphosphate reductase